MPLPTVILPVYNAAADLADCLGSLQRTMGPATSLLIADDASTDPRVGPVIEYFRQRARCRVQWERRERNLGFVANVNLAFRQSAPTDVVILNTDTITTAGWLERLAECAASDPRIATATPWSNNAEICSWPDFCSASELPDDPEHLAAAAAGLAAYPDLPTGVGFCMYIRRQVLDELGDFDRATFGRGYGEENDLCVRAANHGWRNVLCSSAYVAHRGGASFGPIGEAPGGENLRRLCARYPGYNEAVADFILRDPLAPLRDQLAQRVQAFGAEPNQRSLF